MGKKSGGGVRRVTDYFMSIHYGVCHASVEEVRKIIIGDEVAWEGSATGNTILSIHKPMLFGGDEREGGAVGNVQLLFGGATQVLPDILAQKLERTSETAPGYRALFSAFFYGNTPTRGFMWRQNNPYMPATALEVLSIWRGLNSTHARIGDDMNPAHIMYECYTNKVWGLGYDPAGIDGARWQAAAETFFNEDFGLSMGWFEQAEVEDFVREVQDHVQAAIFINSNTGLLDITPIRGDYDIDDLVVFDPSNCDLEGAERKAIEDTINEIVVTWTNPENEEEETLVFQDLGNIASQGGRVVSDPRNYYGVKEKELARALGERDIAMSAHPTFSTQILTDRRARRIQPGDVVALHWPELNIEKMALRVMKKSRGPLGKGQYILDVTEDIFGLEQAVYATAPGTLWTNPTSVPTPIDHVSFFTVPYTALSRYGAIPDEPDVIVGVLGQEVDPAAYSLVLTGERFGVGGAVTLVDTTGLLETAYSTLTVALSQETLSFITSPGLGVWTGAPNLVVGSILMLENRDDETSELVLITAYNSGTDTWTVARGLYDTIPHQWSIGSSVWAIPLTFSSVDPVTRSPGIELSYWVRPRTLSGILPLEQADEEVFTPTERPHLPFRPTNIVIHGSAGFGAVNATGVGSVNLSWSNRNRTMEDTVAVLWNESSVPVETGQTTTLRIRDAVGAIVNEIVDLTGDTYSLGVVYLGSSGSATIEVIAVRAGLESLQNVVRAITYTPISVQTIVGALYEDPDEFYANLVATGSDQTIVGALYEDPDEFYANIIAISGGGGPQTIVGALYEDPDEFYANAIFKTGTQTARIANTVRFTYTESPNLHTQIANTVRFTYVESPANNTQIASIVRFTYVEKP